MTALTIIVGAGGCADTFEGSLPGAEADGGAPHDASLAAAPDAADVSDAANTSPLPTSCVVVGALPVLASGAVLLETDVQGRGTFDFIRGGYGEHVTDAGVLVNLNSNLSFRYAPGKLTVGVQGGEKGRIVRLGSDADVASRIDSTRPLCSGYELLAVVGDAFNDPNAADVFGDPKSADSATAIPGTVYALRLLSSSGEELLVKLRVTRVDGARAVGFDWSHIAPR